MRDREKEKSMSYIKNADIQGNADAGIYLPELSDYCF